MGEDAAFSIRFYREGEADEEVLEMLESVFGHWPGIEIAVPALDHLRWKLSTPGAGGTHIVAEADGRIIASRLSTVRAMKVGHRELRYRFGTDTAVHPDWQGRGVMTATRTFGGETLTQRFDLHGGSTSNEHVLRRDLLDGRHMIANAIEVLEHTLETTSARAGTVAVRAVEAFDARADELWRKASTAFDVAVVRSSAYLNRRYADARAGRFTILLAEEADQLPGYAVLAMSEERGQIADILVAPERPDVLDALVTEGLARLRGLGAARAQVWSPQRHPYRETLLRHGFAPKRHMQGITLGAYHQDIDLSIMDDPELALHYSAGDTDLV